MLGSAREATGPARSTAKPRTPAIRDAAKMPTLASVTDAGSANASSAMNRETVNPTPARADNPTMCRHPHPDGRRPRPVRTARALARLTPRTFPATRPRTTPSVTRLVVASWSASARSEEHTSELQSLAYLVCRLLLEKKKMKHGRVGWKARV